MSLASFLEFSFFFSFLSSSLYKPDILICTQHRKSTSNSEKKASRSIKPDFSSHTKWPTGITVMYCFTRIIHHYSKKIKWPHFFELSCTYSVPEIEQKSTYLKNVPLEVKIVRIFSFNYFFTLINGCQILLNCQFDYQYFVMVPLKEFHLNLPVSPISLPCSPLFLNIPNEPHLLNPVY